jgi:hypothetical protein
MEIRGFSPVDTLYEFSGHSIGLVLGNYLIWNGYLLGFVLAGAVLRLYYLGSLKGSYTDLAVYPVYVLIIAMLAWPIEVNLSAPGSTTVVPTSEGGIASGRQGVFWYPDVTSVDGEEALSNTHKLRVPRMLALGGAMVDALQGALISDIERGVYFSNFEWLRITEINQKSRILDPDLRHDLGVYLAHCYWPAIAGWKSEEAVPWEVVPLAGRAVDEWLVHQYEAMPETFWTSERWTSRSAGGVLRCSDLHAELDLRIGRHLSGEEFHRKAVDTFSRLAEEEGNHRPTGQEYEKFYRRRLLYNEIFVLAGSEAAGVRHALPEISLMAGGGWDYTHMKVGNLNKLTSSSMWDRFGGVWSDLPGITAALLAGVSEWWSQKAIGPATYYRISAMGPYVYGMVTAFLLMLFPVAALMSFWPRSWTSLVNFMKVFVSVKLWPIFWSYTSAMISYRGVFDAEDPEGFQGTFGHEGMVPALAGMYLMAPVLSYIVVSLATGAGVVAMGALSGLGSTGSLTSLAQSMKSGGSVGAAAWNSASSAVRSDASQ